MWRFRSCHARALKGVEQRHRMHREPRFRLCRCANEVKVERTDVYVHRVIRSSCHKPHEPAGTARGMHAHTFKLRLGALEAVSASSNVHPNQSGTPAETCCRVYAYLCRGVEEALRARAARLARKRFFSCTSAISCPAEVVSISVNGSRKSTEPFLGGTLCYRVQKSPRSMALPMFQKRCTAIICLSE